MSGWRSKEMEELARERHRNCVERERKIAEKVTWLRGRSMCGFI